MNNYGNDVFLWGLALVVICICRIMALNDR